MSIEEENNSPEARELIAATLARTRPDLTDTQRGALTDAVAKHGTLPPLLWSAANLTNYKPDWDVSYSLSKVLEEAPHIAVEAPGRKEVVDAIQADHVAKYGSAMSDGERLQTLKRIANATEDELIEEAYKVGMNLKARTLSAMPRAEAQPLAAKAAIPRYSDMDQAALDAEVARRWNVIPNALPVKKLESFRQALRSLDEKSTGTESPFAQLHAQGHASRPMTAQQRLTEFRRKQAAK